MKIELIRLCENKHSIESILLLNGTKQCDATEDKLASLPAGTYPVVLHPCPRIGGLVPLICAEEAEEIEETSAPFAAAAAATAATAAAAAATAPTAPTAPSPIVPTPAMCCRCKALAEKRQAFVEDEISTLEYAMAKGMSGRPLQRYERQLAKQRRIACAKTHLSVCPRLCSGGGIFGDTGGAVLLGTYQLPGMLTNSRAAYRKLLNALRYATKKGNPISLTISNLR